MNLVINKCVTAVKVSNFSGHCLRNRSTLDIGVLGYIGIVQHKEHSPEVLSIPPGTPVYCWILNHPVYKRLKLVSCQACYHSNDWAVFKRLLNTIRHDLLYKAWTDAVRVYVLCTFQNFVTMYLYIHGLCKYVLIKCKYRLAQKLLFANWTWLRQCLHIFWVFEMFRFPFR